MKIFLDFDDVLFNTKQFFADYQLVFARFGVSGEMFERTYAKARKNESGVDGYKYDRHMSILAEEEGMQSAVVRAGVDSFVQNLQQYVFPDVREFLKERKKNGDALYIISTGSPDFQRKKIVSAGLLEYFTEVAIAGEDKIPEFVRMMKNAHMGEKVWFFEDRTEHIGGIKQALPQVKTILVSRPEGRYHDAKTRWCDFEVHNLNEVREIIFNNSTVGA